MDSFKHDFFEDDLLKQYQEEGQYYYLPVSNGVVASLEITEHGYQNLKSIIATHAKQISDGVLCACAWGRITLAIPGVDLKFYDEDDNADERDEDEDVKVMPDTGDVWLSYDNQNPLCIGIDHPYEPCIRVFELQMPEWKHIVSHFEPKTK